MAGHHATLSEADFHQVLYCIEELHRCRTLDDFPGCAVRAFSRLVPNSLAAFNEVNLARNRIIALTDRPLEPGHRSPPPSRCDQRGLYLASPKMMHFWEKHSGQHPLVRYVTETGDGQAIKISDFLSAREYHRLDLYREFYRRLGAEDQMSVTIRSENGVLIALAFNRPARDFSEAERMKLNLVRPHLLQAYANVEELTGHLEEKADLATALRETGHGLLALDSAGKIAHATPGVRDCLARFFPGTVASVEGVPLPILRWVEANASPQLTVPRDGARLIVRRPQNTARRLLLLSEERGSGMSHDPHLTSREHEVLRWLAHGKANREIAIILGLSPGTVKIHVEHILAKLGAENRTAATVIAFTLGLVTG